MAKRKKVRVDVDHLSNIGAVGGNTTKKRHGKGYYSKLAKKSHPRKHYNGGRPAGSKNKPKA